MISCLEPIKNIYIARNGSVRVCCHNHHFEIGHLKNNSLIDIWRSPRRKEFARRLYYGSDEPSCFNCNQPDWKKHLYPFALKYKSNHQFPLSIDFELSNICNLACIMCSPLYSSQLAKHYDNPDDISYDFKNLLQQLLPFIPYLKHANFYGGEPLLIDIYHEIWDLILKNNKTCAIYFQTNGTVFNDRIENLLKKGIFNIGISIESIRKETYERVRKNSDIDVVLANIDRFLDYSKKKNTFFGVSVCPIRSNWKELPEMTEYFSERQIPIHFHFVSRPFNLTLWNLPKEELSEIHDYLSHYKFNSANIIAETNIQQFEKLCGQIYKWHNDATEREAQIVLRKPRKTEEIVSELITSAIKFMDSLHWITPEEKETRISSFSKKMNAVSISVADKVFLNKQLEKLLFAPIYILLSEIKTASVKEIKENILYL